VVDLRHLHYGAVHDPIKALVECGTGRDVETVIVDGQTLVEQGRAVRVDESALLRDVQSRRRAALEGDPAMALERQAARRHRAAELSRA
jgi:5-methylthioadenosine/S-adenosylhomocysteine deaminase